MILTMITISSSSEYDVYKFNVRTTGAMGSMPFIAITQMKNKGKISI